MRIERIHTENQMDGLSATGDFDPSSRRPLVGPVGRSSTALTIGRFRTDRILGEGGMGVVYLAEQDNPRRQVALKVIRPGMASAGLLKRFEFEAQVLGRLQHPGIAQIYDAGTADAGAGPQPYFAMELVQGIPLTEYARTRRLGTRERLRLMGLVCEAVQHAHSKGVIHRDLKPGNILVTDEGQPKILDFGVARATDADVQRTTMQTDVGALVGTLPYMSPEQVAGDPGGLDSRSDVYALGVILYELLAERPPYQLGDRAILEAARMIQEEEPTRLSVVSKVFRGDVETIASKALEKDRGRRYQTASELGDDIRRYLSDEPIMARPPSATYQITKFARRHKGVVAGIVVAFVALLGALGVVSGALAQSVAAQKREEQQRRQAETARSQAEGLLELATTQRDRAQNAEREAQRQAEAAEAARTDAMEQMRLAEASAAEAMRQRGVVAVVNEFMNKDLLSSVAPEEQGIDVRVRDVLDAASTRLDQASGEGGILAGQPEVQAELRSTLGVTYRRLGEREKAERHLREAVRLRRELEGDSSVRTIAAIDDLAIALLDQGKAEEAEGMNLEAMMLANASLAPDDRIRLSVLHDRATILVTAGRYEEAGPLLDEVIEGRRRVLGAEHPDTLTAIQTMAFLHERTGEYEKSEELGKWLVEAFARTLGEEHPDTLMAMNNLATLYDGLGRSVEAEPLLRRIVAVRTRVLGADHPNTLVSISNLAYCLDTQERNDEAEVMYREVLDARRARFGPDHPQTLLSLNNLASLLDETGRGDEAEPMLVELVAARKRTSGADHPDTIIAINNLAVRYLRQGRLDEAIVGFTEARDASLRTMGEDDPSSLNATNNLAFTLLRAGRYEESEAMFRGVVEAGRRTLPADHWFLGVLMGSHGAALSALERLDEAEQTLLAAYDITSAALGAESARCQTIAAHLMRLYRKRELATPGQDFAAKAEHWRALAGEQGED